MKEYKCIELKNHRDVVKTIERQQIEGWQLHTYQAAGLGSGPLSNTVNHYLLFEKSR